MDGNKDHTNTETPVLIPVIQQLKIAFTNKPFLYVVGIYLCSWLSLQLTASIIPYFVVSYMGLKPQDSAQLMIAVQGTALLMLFGWSKISERVGKKVVYYWGTGLWIIAQVGLFQLQPNQVGWMYFLGVMAGVGVSTAYLVPWSMLPDVLDLDELQTGQRREGIFYSFIVFIQKICLGIAVAIVLQSLQWNGYIQPTEILSNPIQPSSVLLMIRIAIGPLPIICLIIGLFLAYLYPISKEVHQQILLEINEKKSAPKS
jgi:GPH family glycoside/pentoside/hexuronide:cation symporter